MAGVKMKKYYRGDLHVEYKDGENRSPVTIADKEINEELITYIQDTFPQHGVRGEEMSWCDDRDNLWVVDPIDGTRMYTHHIPTSMFSLAYVENGEVKVAVCYNPWTGDEYTAVKGSGAFRNGEKIQVQSVGEKDISVGIWLKDLSYAEKVWRKHMTPIVMYPMVMKGCLVAEGSLSVVFAGNGVGTHDIAATSLLVTEAGGVVLDIDGIEQRYDKEVNGVIMGRKDALSIAKMII